MKLVAIESPLAGDFQRNRRYALWCAFHCFTLGEAAYASHLFFPQFLDDQNPEHRRFGMAGGLEWASRADLHAFYVDCGMSPGMLDAWNAAPHSSDYVKRTLPPEMLAAFQRGEYPGATEAFR